MYKIRIMEDVRIYDIIETNLKDEVFNYINEFLKRKGRYSIQVFENGKLISFLRIVNY